jgi:hypothetical protein
MTLMSKTDFRKKTIFSALFLLAGAFYFFTRTFQFTFDSISYLISAQNGLGNYYHPHHLIFSPLLRAIYLLFNGVFGWNISIALIGQLFSITIAVTGVFLVYQLCLMINKDKITALTASAVIFLLSYWWQYATQAEVYAASTTCLLLCSYFLFSEKTDNEKIIGTALFWALAVLFHQTAVLFLFPLGYFLMYLKKPATLFLVCFVSGVIVTTCYLTVIYHLFHSISIELIKHFVFAYYFHDEPDWGTFRHFSLKGLNDLWNAYQTAVTGSDIASTLNKVLGIGLVMFVVMGIAECKAPYKYFFIIWMITQLVFTLWWLPSDAEFLISSLPICALFCGMGLKRGTPTSVMRWPYYLASFLMVCMLGAINFPQVRNLMNPAEDFVDRSDEVLEMVPDHAVLGLKDGMVNYLVIFQYQQKRKYIRLEEVHDAIRRGVDESRLFSFVKRHPLFIPMSHLCPAHYEGAGDFGHLSEDYQKFVKWLLREGQEATRKVEIVPGRNRDYLLLSGNGVDMSADALMAKLASGGYCLKPAH